MMNKKVLSLVLATAVFSSVLFSVPVAADESDVSSLLEQYTAKNDEISDQVAQKNHYLKNQLNEQFYKDFEKLIKDKKADILDADYALEKQTFDEINAFREKNGLKAFKWSDNLLMICRMRAAADFDVFNGDHDISYLDLGMPGDTIAKYGLSKKSYPTENFAMQMSTKQKQYTGEDIFTAWLNSAGHKANMLKKDRTYAAVGILKGRDIAKSGDRFSGYFAVFICSK